VSTCCIVIKIITKKNTYAILLDGSAVFAISELTGSLGKIGQTSNASIFLVKTLLENDFIGLMNKRV
jgi:hypothetical protein